MIDAVPQNIDFIKENLKKPVVLIGMAGAGKTTISKMLATQLDWPFLDCDDEIVRKEQKSIPQIFLEDGETYFREIELQNLQEILGRKSEYVLGTGGGTFMNEKARRLIHEKAVSIFLKVDVETLAARVGDGTGRPLFNNKDPKTVLTSLVKERYPAYEKADIEVLSKNESIEDTTNNVLNSLYNFLVTK